MSTRRGARGECRGEVGFLNAAASTAERELTYKSVIEAPLSDDIPRPDSIDGEGELLSKSVWKAA